MPIGRELETILLSGQGERPLRGSLRNLMYGIIAAIVLALIHLLMGSFQMKNMFGYVLIGNGISFFGWGAERLWYSTISKMLVNPFSWFAYVTRLPFWYIAGGIGYTLAMLFSKKYGFLEIYDIPVKHLFEVGGIIECSIQVPLQVMVYRKLARSSLIISTG